MLTLAALTARRYAVVRRPFNLYLLLTTSAPPPPHTPDIFRPPSQPLGSTEEEYRKLEVRCVGAPPPLWALLSRPGTPAPVKLQLMMTLSLQDGRLNLERNKYLYSPSLGVQL